jgi:hypothetical protein
MRMISEKAAALLSAIATSGTAFNTFIKHVHHLRLKAFDFV